MPSRITIRCLLAPLLALFLGLAPTAGFALEGQLNLNTATVEQLEMLPTIGQGRAKAINDYRRQHGAFRSLEQLLTSKLVGESSLAAIRPYVSLSGANTLNATAPSSANRKPAAPVPITLDRHLTSRPGEIRLLADDAYFPALLQAIEEAQRKIEMAMFLFKTTESPDNRPTRLTKALIDARRRGVQVEVLLEKSGYDEGINKENEEVAALLRKNRIDVRFDTPETTTHTKLVVIDSRYVFLGSHNLTQAALKHNHEFSLLIDNATLAREASDYIGRIRIKE
ncbi:MAG TPA: phospholipase D-like domain-containing protein [Desulfurivibrionaceae bacterium]|nr:phospholipase D-like domain-containing protein [Desulfurivibrionaceae bacterium]